MPDALRIKRLQLKAVNDQLVDHQRARCAGVLPALVCPSYLHICNTVLMQPHCDRSI